MIQKQHVKPVISVIIATYNRPGKLGDTLRQLCKQTLPAEQFEVVVVDDGSGVDYATVKKTAYPFHFTFISLDINGGSARARNAGARAAHGAIVAFTDDDCLPPTNWLSSLLSEYKDASIKGVGGYVEASADRLKKSAYHRWEKLNENKYIRMMDKYISTARDEAPFQTSNISYLKEAFDALGGFNENTPRTVSGEDGDLKEKFVSKGYKVVFIPLKMIHNEDYSLKRFFRQQMIRGGGIQYFLQSRGRAMQHPVFILVRIALIPLRTLLSLLKYEVKVAFIDTIAYLARNIGKIKYYLASQKDASA